MPNVDISRLNAMSNQIPKRRYKTTKHQDSTSDKIVVPSEGVEPSTARFLYA